MKILQVTNFFKPSWESGGPARIAYEISKKLMERCHEVTIYTTDGYKSRLNVEKNKPINVDGIKTYYFRNLSNYLVRKMVLMTPYYLPIVARREIKDFDVIHIHEHRTMLAAIVHYYAKKYNVPYVLQVHGSVLPTFQKQRQNKIFDLFFGYKILKDASKVIAQSETEVEKCEKMGASEDKVVTVPNGIDTSEYEILPKRGEFRRNYSIRDDEKVVLYIGRLHKSKGIDLLVKSFADLTKELDDVKLVIVGPDDGFLSTLKRQIKDFQIGDKVLFTGPLYERNKMTALVDADTFVTPSFSGFPVTFLEACASGTPIITTNKGDELEWIHDKVGYVVEYDKDKLNDAMFKIFGDEGLRRRFGEEGRRLVMEEFGWDKIIKKLEDLYMGCLPSIKQKVI